MKTLFFLSVLSSFLGMTSTSLSGNQGRGTNDSIQDRFVGAWRLASLETQDADGKTHRADSTGLLVFTRDGHMSVQVMERNPPAHTTAASEQYSQGGYEASFGSYQINESTRLRALRQPAYREVHPPRRTLESHLGALLAAVPTSLPWDGEEFSPGRSPGYGNKTKLESRRDD